ncbi:MAG: VWA domain-containing protein, partial [Acidobacteriota bacterium]|nr:VWA domain-containing protein [Acidobacteriota bacterium]
MTFAHPSLLLVALLPLGWIAYAWRKTVRRLSLVLKGLSIAAIFLALAQPTITLPETKIAEFVLVDTSGSITSQDLARASSLAREIERNRGGNWVKIVPFASSIRALRPEELSGALRLQQISDSVAATNLESALTGSMAAIPNGYLPRFLLVSDGNENEGSAVRAIAQLRRLHIPVDTIPLGGKSGSALRLQSVSLPHDAYSAELIPIDLTVSSPVPTSAT